MRFPETSGKEHKALTEATARVQEPLIGKISPGLCGTTSVNGQFMAKLNREAAAPVARRPTLRFPDPVQGD